MKIMITVVVALKSTCCLKHWHRAQRSREAYCRGTGLGGESGWSRNTWNWRVLQVKRTSVLGLQGTNSVNILLIDIFFPVLLFLSCKFLLLSTHLFIPTHPPSKLLLPHSCKMAILQSSKMLCMRKGCRIRHVSLCVKQRDVPFACVRLVPSKENEDFIFFSPSRQFLQYMKCG